MERGNKRHFFSKFVTEVLGLILFLLLVRLFRANFI